MNKIMNGMKKFADCCMDNPKSTIIIIGAIVIGAIIGAYWGVQAYYNGWLG